MKELIKLAESDIYACEKAEPDLPDEYAARIVSYHIQQAVEKVLKAYISFYGENPPYKHDIAELCDIAEGLGIELPPESKDIADTLTLWESKARYDPYISFSIPKYEKAKTVYEVLRKNLISETQKLSDSPDNTDKNG